MKIKLRKWLLSDAKDLAECGNDCEVSKYLRDIFPFLYTLENAKEYLEFVTNANGNEEFYAVDYEGKAIGAGNIGYRTDVNRKSAGIGYWIGREYWGKGIGTDIVALLCEKAFAKKEIIRVDAEIVADNIGSRRILEKNGFQLEGRLKSSIYKNKQFYDSLIFGKCKKVE